MMKSFILAATSIAFMFSVSNIANANNKDSETKSSNEINVNNKASNFSRSNIITTSDRKKVNQLLTDHYRKLNAIGSLENNLGGVLIFKEAKRIEILSMDRDLVTPNMDKVHIKVVEHQRSYNYTYNEYAKNISVSDRNKKFSTEESKLGAFDWKLFLALQVETGFYLTKQNNIWKIESYGTRSLNGIKIPS